MLQRTSVVDRINVNVVSFSSIIEIGDATYHQAHSRALAVQRQKELFFGKEGAFENYSVFNEPIPLAPITENIYTHFENVKPIIKVNHINITGVSSASLLQVGNCRHLQSEARIKHIRQLEQSVSNPIGGNFIQLQAPSQFNMVTPESPVLVTGTDITGKEINSTPEQASTNEETYRKKP